MKKGFTLVELIAVIIILSIVTLLSFSSMTKTFKNNDIRKEVAFYDSIKNAAQLYVETSYSSFNGNFNGSVSVSTLISDKYLESSVYNKLDDVLEKKCSSFKENINVKYSQDSNGVITYSVHCGSNSTRLDEE